METCHGCSVNGACTLQHFGSVAMNQCPCINCVLKIICKDSCEKFTSHCANVFNPLTQEALNKEKEKK